LVAETAITSQISIAESHSLTPSSMLAGDVISAGAASHHAGPGASEYSCKARGRAGRPRIESMAHAYKGAGDRDMIVR